MVAGLSMALFLPVMGSGFIHDDFLHLYSAAYHSLRRGLTCANGGPFYTPVTWLTFKLDWVLWGTNPFLSAMANLLLHIANITLLYLFALKLWGSQVAARWAALGFALLFPANTWAMMWISTRAHLLVTFFYLASLLATLWLIRSERQKKLAAATVFLFATLSIFSKESGVTTPAAIAILLVYLRRSRVLPPITIALLFGSLIAVLAVYGLIRSRSAAIPITFSAKVWYTYTPSLSVLSENLLRYGWRTFGLLGILACAIALSQIVRGRRPRLGSVRMNNVLLSASLFGVTIAPFILLRGRSGIYTYLPGIAAALLLGAAARAFYDAPSETSARIDHLIRFRPLSATPILLVVFVYGLLTVIHSLRWMRMAEINTLLLNQIAEKKIKPQPNALFILTYSEADNIRGFPDGMSHGFSCALRLLYADSTLNGLIARQGELLNPYYQAPVIQLSYTLGSDGAPRLVIITDKPGYFPTPP